MELTEPKAQVTNILLTGVPGTGKTTAIRRTLELLPEIRAGGFVTAAIEEGGRRTGFSISDLNGLTGVLASTTLASGPLMAAQPIALAPAPKG